MTTCSTHVLDAAAGRPATGVAVRLSHGGTTIAETVTDGDGRVRFDVDLGPGDHRLTFATGAWFARDGRPALFPEVLLSFTVTDDQPHYHVALLLSPYAYTTYRGS